MTLLTVALSGAAAAAPASKVFVDETQVSFDAGGAKRIRQFDPAKGVLSSVRVEGSGAVALKFSLGGPLTKPTPYAFTAGLYIYYGQPSLHLVAKGSDTFKAFANEQTIIASGSGEETVSGAALAAFKGKGDLLVTFASDMPKPAPNIGVPVSVKAGDYSGTLRLTYRYVPTISKLPPVGPLPKQTPPRLPKP